jgi:hypothetical protein
MLLLLLLLLLPCTAAFTLRKFEWLPRSEVSPRPDLALL